MWTSRTGTPATRTVRVEALVWNTGAMGTWVLSPKRRAASAPWTWTVSPLPCAMVSTTSWRSGTTAPTNRLVLGRTKTPWATRRSAPSAASRESVRAMAPREPSSAKRPPVNGLPFGSLATAVRTDLAVDMA